MSETYVPQNGVALAGKVATDAGRDALSIGPAPGRAAPMAFR